MRSLSVRGRNGQETVLPKRLQPWGSGGLDRFQGELGPVVSGPGERDAWVLPSLLLDDEQARAATPAWLAERDTFVAEHDLVTA